MHLRPSMKASFSARFTLCCGMFCSARFLCSHAEQVNNAFGKLIHHLQSKLLAVPKYVDCLARMMNSIYAMVCAQRWWVCNE